MTSATTAQLVDRFKELLALFVAERVLVKELGKNFTIVDQSGPGVAKLSAALTDATSAVPVLRTISLVSFFLPDRRCRTSPASGPKLLSLNRSFGRQRSAPYASSAPAMGQLGTYLRTVGALPVLPCGASNGLLRGGRGVRPYRQSRSSLQCGIAMS